jgi:3-phenylpropionate/cinnamic acid dioxygenase small subunit
MDYHDICRFLYHEAALLDARQFEDWLDLFTEDAIYWVPAWNDDGSLTTNPQSEVSLIYYDSKARLGERVWRIRSGMSAASNPLPRTTHLVTNIQVENATIAQPLIKVSNAWQANSFSLTTQETTCFFGYTHSILRQEGGQLRIKEKKIVVANDLIQGLMDIYSII